MAFILPDGAVGYPLGYGLQNLLPELYEFPRGFDPGEGLERSVNEILLDIYGEVGIACNFLRARQVLESHDLSTEAIPPCTHEDVRAMIVGEAGIMALTQVVTNLGGNPVPVPERLRQAVNDLLQPVNPFNALLDEAVLEIPDERLMQQQERLGVNRIVEQFHVPPELPHHPLNQFLSIHYRNMAKLVNKILARRMRKHLLPGSYYQRTRDVAASLVNMKTVALRSKLQIIADMDGDADAPFRSDLFAVRNTFLLYKVMRLE